MIMANPVLAIRQITVDNSGHKICSQVESLVSFYVSNMFFLNRKMARFEG